MRSALREDRAADDRTTRLLLRGPVPAEADVIAQASGVLSGIAAARATAIAQGLRVVSGRADGSPVRPGTVVLRLRGDARRILASERTILNFVMHLSGVATATRRAVDGARGARRPLEVWATRKTLPGLRDLEKAAVVHGGGRPHRRDLSDAVLIKNNHLALLPLGAAVERARAHARAGEPIEVEVRTETQALVAARSGADALLLDNVPPRRARAIVRRLERAGLRHGRWVELSGGITPERVARYRSVGADAVSLGGITHSAPALRFHLVLRPAGLRRRGA
ncbi:MAG TPA: carboxylating nicotinate-nucleotide diphosphorylase [Thermoplasmata archaeon]|nr:carboxylating nicotinate-nucleotide diphosphorylase [Thermoplasmata archaeon]